MGLIQTILNNWSVFLLLILAVVGIFAKTRSALWFRWLSETAIYAWHTAERLGLENDWSGAQKLDQYMSEFEQAYKNKFGAVPTQTAIEQAAAKAAGLSAFAKLKGSGTQLSLPLGSVGSNSKQA